MMVMKLANELKKMYEKGIPERNQTTIIHLFGIKYVDMSESYQVEINKGIELAKYVQLKLK